MALRRLTNARNPHQHAWQQTPHPDHPVSTLLLSAGASMPECTDTRQQLPWPKAHCWRTFLGSTDKAPFACSSTSEYCPIGRLGANAHDAHPASAAATEQVPTAPACVSAPCCCHCRKRMETVPDRLVPVTLMAVPVPPTAGDTPPLSTGVCAAEYLQTWTPSHECTSMGALLLP